MSELLTNGTFEAWTSATNCDLDAAGEFFLFEWNGSKWQVVYGTGTITSQWG